MTCAKSLKFAKLYCEVLSDEAADDYRPHLSKYQPRHETFKRTERKGRGLPKPSAPKALKALGQIAFNKKWEKLGAVAAVRPQDGLWQVDVPGHAAMHGADLALLDLCVQSIDEQSAIARKTYFKSYGCFNQ